VQQAARCALEGRTRAIGLTAGIAASWAVEFDPRLLPG